MYLHAISRVCDYVYEHKVLGFSYIVTDALYSCYLYRCMMPLLVLGVILYVAGIICQRCI